MNFAITVSFLQIKGFRGFRVGKHRNVLTQLLILHQEVIIIVDLIKLKYLC